MSSYYAWFALDEYARWSAAIAVNLLLAIPEGPKDIRRSAYRPIRTRGKERNLEKGT